MISGRSDERRRAYEWSALGSIALHALLAVVLFMALARVMIENKGKREHVSQTTVVAIEQRVVATPQPSVRAQPVRAVPAAAPRPRVHELARLVAHAPPQPPPRRHSSTLGSRIARDQNAFANEVAKLNASNDPNAIPTIDPGARASYTKSYSMQIAGGAGSSAGNGLITTTRSWHEHGLDCYYGHYEYTYGDGSVEENDIAWPFCFTRGSDPFLSAPHPIPMPLPVAGFRIAPGTQLPPLERDVYQQWLASGG